MVVGVGAPDGGQVVIGVGAPDGDKWWSASEASGRRRRQVVVGVGHCCRMSKDLVEELEYELFFKIHGIKNLATEIFSEC